MDPVTSCLPTLTIWGLFWLVFPWISVDSHLARRGCFYLYSLLQTTYLVWRVFFTIPPPSPILPFAYAVLVLTVELTITYSAFRFLRGLLRTRDRTREANDHEAWHSGGQDAPVVDILIATYNESWPILEKTLVGALRQDYQRTRVWICDDGRRSWLKTAVEAMGARYVTRSDNKHAKAGNLNAALKHVLAEKPASDFIAVLDADFIPRRRFLSRTLSLMHDREVGLVQTPQYHLNPDPFQTAFQIADKLPDTQRYVFNVILPARDADGGAYCCGTSFLARTAAIEVIGGFPTESITEDVLTSVKMGMHGYRTVYLRELLTTGLAPEGLHEYLTQRGRWSLGGVQIGRWLTDRARAAGASATARLVVLEPFVRWGYVSLARALFMMVPVLYWVTGAVPFVSQRWWLLWFALPALVLQRMFMSWMSRASHMPIVTHAGAVLASFAVVPGMLKGLGPAKEHRFVVTDKGMNHAGLVIHWHVLRWLLAYIVVLTGVMCYRLLFEPGPTAMTGSFRYVSMLWSIINVMVAVVAVFPCLEQPRRREEYRYLTTEQASLVGPTGTVRAELRDLSVSGIRLSSPEPLAIGGEVALSFGGLPPMRAVVVWHEQKDAVPCYGLRFEITDQQRRELIFRIFCTDQYIHPADEGSGIATLVAVLRRMFA